ncbi:hypothetical protein H4R34_004911 [Dimargaris verticillata]|uniref:BHLH domain-containing protein n=1 Tax=Dimargaris verticillata TaxID=2761393 RepID=A0A9W8AZR8_9FUNG|nr:hypothetical protein H4R34_004911 [Dimargaris verticillata]
MQRTSAAFGPGLALEDLGIDLNTLLELGLGNGSQSTTATTTPPSNPSHHRQPSPPAGALLDQLQHAIKQAHAEGNHGLIVQLLHLVQQLQGQQPAALPATPQSQRLGPTTTPSTHLAINVPETTAPNGLSAASTPLMSPTFLPGAAMDAAGRPATHTRASVSGPARRKRQYPTDDASATVSSRGLQGQGMASPLKKPMGSLKHPAITRAPTDFGTMGQVSTAHSRALTHNIPHFLDHITGLDGNTGLPMPHHHLEQSPAGPHQLFSSPMFTAHTPGTYPHNTMLPSPFLFDPAAWAQLVNADASALGNLNLTSPALMSSPITMMSTSTSPAFHPGSVSGGGPMDFTLGSPSLNGQTNHTMAAPPPPPPPPFSPALVALPGPATALESSHTTPTLHQLNLSQGATAESTQQRTANHSHKTSPALATRETLTSAPWQPATHAQPSLAAQQLQHSSSAQTANSLLTPATPASLMHLTMATDAQTSAQVAHLSSDRPMESKEVHQPFKGLPEPLLPASSSTPHALKRTKNPDRSKARNKRPKSTTTSPASVGTVPASPASLVASIASRPQTDTLPPSFTSPSLTSHSNHLPSTSAELDSTPVTSSSSSPNIPSSAPATPYQGVLPLSRRLSSKETITKVPISPLPRGNKGRPSGVDQPPLAPYEIASRLAQRSNYQNMLTGDSQRLGLNYDQDLHSNLEQRRTNHKAAEQKRRDSLKRCFDHLKTKLPNLDEKLISKVYLLNKASDYITQLEALRTQDQEHIAQLQQQLLAAQGNEAEQSQHRSTNDTEE